MPKINSLFRCKDEFNKKVDGKDEPDDCYDIFKNCDKPYESSRIVSTSQMNAKLSMSGDKKFLSMRRKIQRSRLSWFETFAIQIIIASQWSYKDNGQ
jgi:hypothetical protein